MKVLVVGASGFLGGAAARALTAAGHAVTPASRATGLDVGDPASLAAAASAHEGVVYAVQLNAPDAAAVEKRALAAIVGALAPRGGAFVYTSGCWYYGPTGEAIAGENAPANPPPAGLERPNLERIVFDAAARGVRGVVLRPGDVYGEGKGLPAMWTQSAREGGRAKFVGDGTNRWPVVHVDDLAHLYASALERAKAGSVYNAADETSFTVAEMAQAASRGAGCGGATEAWPVDDAIAALGLWAAALAMDQRVSSARARAELGWTTRATTILEDLDRGSYAR